MLVRREGPGDVAAVTSVVASACARPDAPDEVPVEVRLLEELRDDEGWVPQLSLVAAEPAGAENAEQEIVGHVLCSRGAVDGSR